MLPLLFLIISHSKFGEPVLLAEASSEKISCHIGDSSFWKLYNWYFGNATTIKISLLSRKHPTFGRSYLSNILLHLFENRKFKKSFVLTTTVVEWQRNVTDFSKLPRIEYIHSYNYASGILFEDEVYDEFMYVQKIRKYSGDPEDAYFFIVFDVEDLTIFLKKHQRKVLRNPRGCYVINILSNDITNLRVDLKSILDLLWVKFGVLNVIVRLPCSVVYRSTFRFDPFEYTNGSWGVLQEFDLDKVEQNPGQFTSSLRNMQGYPVNISMFVRRPTAILEIPKAVTDYIYYRMFQKSGGYGGVDGLVLAYISDYLNFTAKIVTPAIDREYGFVLNGTLVGSLGDVVYHYVQASFNGRFISNYDSDLIEFTNPTSNDYLCLLVPKSEKVPQWLKVSHCFKAQTWLSILGLYIIISIYWSVANKVVITKTKRNKRNIEDSFFEVLTLLISVPFRQVPYFNQKVFIAVCLIFNVIFVGTFQGSLYNSYTKDTYFPDINTLEELDKFGLSITTSSQSLINTFGTDPKPIMQRLKDKIVVLNGSSSLDLVAENRDSAAFERKADAKLRIKTEYTRKSDGFELLHVMDECPWINYVSYIVPLGSPYLHAFNYLITTFLEAGLISKWNLDTVDGLILEKRVRPKVHSESLKPFTLEDMQAAFYLISLGLLLAFVVFLGETLVHCCNKLIDRHNCGP